MVILDTDIVPEMMHPLPNPGVVAWLNRQPASAGMRCGPNHIPFFLKNWRDAC
jgi:hypothetical protein